MLRASALVEEVGVPSVSLTCEGFLSQAASTASGLGMPNLPVALVPGHVDVQSAEELRRNVLEVTVDAVIQGLTVAPAEAPDVIEPRPSAIVFEGTPDEVNRVFYENGWSDGLPIVPPTETRVREFLRFTDRDADEELGVLLPDMRSATVRTVAVNGVMAGCRPEYMPVLVALVEAMADRRYGVEHSGNTWRVVLAENEDVLGRIGWTTIAQDQGLAAGDNAVTISRFTGGGVIVSVFGDGPDRMIPYLADGIARFVGWEVIFTVGMADGAEKPLLVLSPILAETLARAGLSKQDVKLRLFEHARIPAWKFERYIGGWTNFTPGQPTLADLVRHGRAPAIFAESDDPNRLVPVVAKPEDIMIAVSGDPLRTNAYVFAHNGILGYPTTKTIGSRRSI